MKQLNGVANVKYLRIKSVSAMIITRGIASVCVVKIVEESIQNLYKHKDTIEIIIENEGKSMKILL
jgi:hypothetical protein|tara:strand:+ start:522 stop:719 length:198 start_codon:yes stop_codon:yes gene_type:complete